MQLSSSTLKDLARLMVIWKSNSLSQTFIILWFGPKMFISWKVTGKKILPGMATLVEFSWYSDLVCINTVGRSQFIWNGIHWVLVHLIICLPSYKVCPLDGNLGTQTHNSVCFTIPSKEQVFQFLQLVHLKWQADTIPATCLLWVRYDVTLFWHPVPTSPLHSLKWFVTVITTHTSWLQLSILVYILHKPYVSRLENF